jgi:hypothetical protein
MYTSGRQYSEGFVKLSFIINVTEHVGSHGKSCPLYIGGEILSRETKNFELIFHGFTQSLREHALK